MFLGFTQPIADNHSFNLSKVVVDEIQLIGSRCGPFEPTINALSQKQINTSSLISAIYSFDKAEIAFKYATKPGIVKVLLQF